MQFDAMAAWLSRADAVLRRLLGGMSIFTMLMTNPPSLSHMGRAASCWGFAPILGRVSGLSPAVVWVWHTQRRQEHLLGLRRLDCTGRCRDRGSDPIWIALVFRS